MDSVCSTARSETTVSPDTRPNELQGIVCTPLSRKLCRLAIRARAKYGRKLSPNVVKLAPNLVIKFGRTITLAEANAMKFVADNTSLPVPRLIDTFMSKNGVRFIVMQHVRGKPLSQVWHKLSPQDKTAILLDLRHYIEELRQVPPPQLSVVGSVDYTACTDDRIAPESFGPFENHEAFHQFLRWGVTEEHPSIPALTRIAQTHKTYRHRTVLTHGDLAPQNIIVREGKIVGIIDWETAGWFPEYWEYTQAWESAWRWKEWRARLGEFLDVYEAELNTEQMRIRISS